MFSKLGPNGAVWWTTLYKTTFLVNFVHLHILVNMVIALILCGKDSDVSSIPLQHMCVPCVSTEGGMVNKN